MRMRMIETIDLIRKLKRALGYNVHFEYIRLLDKSDKDRRKKATSRTPAKSTWEPSNLFILRHSVWQTLTHLKANYKVDSQLPLGIRP